MIDVVEKDAESLRDKVIIIRCGPKKTSDFPGLSTEIVTSSKSR